MLKIAVVDDVNDVCVLVESLLIKLSKKYGIASEIDVLYSGDELKKQLDMGAFYDVIFLDIEMNGLSGIDVSKYLRETMDNDSMQIVYISGKTEYAVSLFDYDPILFLVKPLDEQIIEKAFNKLIKKLSLHSETFEYNVGSYKYKISKKDICYFQRHGRVIQMHFYSGDEKTAEFYSSIEKLAKEFDEKDGFLTIDKSCIINSLHVKEYNYTHVIMDTGKELKIAQPRRKHIREIQLKLELEDPTF